MGEIDSVREDNRRDRNKVLVFLPNFEPNSKHVLTTFGYNAWVKPDEKELYIKSVDYNCGILVVPKEGIDLILDGGDVSRLGKMVHEFSARDTGNLSPLSYSATSLEDLSETMSYQIRLNIVEGNMVIHSIDYPAGTLILEKEFLDRVSMMLGDKKKY